MSATDNSRSWTDPTAKRCPSRPAYDERRRWLAAASAPAAAQGRRPASVAAVASTPVRSSERRVSEEDAVIGLTHISATVPAGIRRSWGYARLVRDLATLTAADFAALRGDRFRIAPDDAEPFEAELVEVTEIPREPGGRAPFSLVFQGGPNPPLPQRIYRVEHDAARRARDLPRPDRRATATRRCSPEPAPLQQQRRRPCPRPAGEAEALVQPQRRVVLSTWIVSACRRSRRPPRAGRASSARPDAARRGTRAAARCP